jgi:hypothetical protein
VKARLSWMTLRFVAATLLAQPQSHLRLLLALTVLARKSKTLL